MTELPPAHEEIIELTVCKTGWKTNRCKCKKNGDLNCTEMCKYENWKNTNSADMVNVDGWSSGWSRLDELLYEKGLMDQL